MKLIAYVCTVKLIITQITMKEMKEKPEKMVLRYHYDKLPDKEKLRRRDEYLRRSGMSLITFYYKLRTETFKPLEQELFDKLFVKG